MLAILENYFTISFVFSLKILNKYEVKKIIRGGLERTGLTNWKNANSAIVAAKDSGKTEVIILKNDELHFGSTFIFGETLVTFVSGFYAPPDSWDIEGGKTGGEFRNAGSIVIRLSFNGKSILFTGDAVGRHREDPDDVCIATEKFMIQNSDAINIDSDINIIIGNNYYLFSVPQLYITHFQYQSNNHNITFHLEII